MTGSPHTSPLPDPIPQPLTPQLHLMTFHKTNCSLSFPVICYSCLPAGAETDLRLSRLTSSSCSDLGRTCAGVFLSRQETSGRLEPATFAAECMFHVTSDPLCSILQQGRPLREQQEVAAAVIQRCYKKYKQVSVGFLIASHCRVELRDFRRPCSQSFLLLFASLHG